MSIVVLCLFFYNVSFFGILSLLTLSCEKVDGKHGRTESLRRATEVACTLTIWLPGNSVVCLSVGFFVSIFTCFESFVTLHVFVNALHLLAIVFSPFACLYSGVTDFPIRNINSHFMQRQFVTIITVAPYFHFYNFLCVNTASTIV